MEQRGKTIIPRDVLQRKHQEAMARKRGEQLARDWERLPARLEALELAHRLATDTSERRRLADERDAVRRALEAKQ